MDWSQPVTLSPEALSQLQQLSLYVGHLDCRLYVGEGYIDIGAGSLGLLTFIDYVDDKRPGKRGEIGRFCEFATTVRVLAGGDHRNDQPVNICLNGLPILQGRFSAEAIHEAEPFHIGNGVVISEKALVLPGARIGDGAVIGAGAVVKGEIEPYAIAAGVPAKTIRLRERAQPWWDFDLAYLMNNLDRIQDVARSPGPHPWRKDRPRLALRKNPAGFELLGLAEGDEVTPLSAAPLAFRDYIVQAFASQGARVWRADPWAD